MPRNCTPSLIKKKRKHISLLRALFKKGTDNGFYTAVSHDGSTELWWIEANQLGSTSCYPCVLIQNGEEHAFVSGRTDKEKASNKSLMEKWQQAVTPETIETDFTVTEMGHEDFFREFGRAEDRQLRRLFSTKKAEPAPDLAEPAEQTDNSTVKSGEEGEEK